VVAGLDLGAAAEPGCGSHRRDASARDEEQPLESALARGSDEAELERPQPREPVEVGRDRLDGCDPVAQPRRVLVAERLGVRGELAP
jgi:hypothetical protein